MNKRTSTMICAVAMLLLLDIGLSGKMVSAQSEQTYVMRIGYAGKGDAQDIAAANFKKNLEAAVGKRIKVELYPAGQMGSNEMMLQKLQQGTIQGVYNPPGFLGGRYDLLTILDLPYFLETDDIGAAKILNGPVGSRLTKGLEKYGMVNLRFVPAGERILLTNFRVDNSASFSGKKVRVMLSPVMINTYRSWGASGVPLNVPELYTALQQGTVDAADITVMFAYNLKFHEVTKYLVMIPRVPLTVLFLANKKWLDTLPGELRKAIDTAVNDDENAAKEAVQLTANFTEKMLREGKEQIFPSENLLKELKESSKPVHSQFLKEYPDAKPIYDEIIRAQKKE